LACNYNFIRVDRGSICAIFICTSTPDEYLPICDLSGFIPVDCSPNSWIQKMGAFDRRLVICGHVFDWKLFDDQGHPG
jgi:hypothetical protein